VPGIDELVSNRVTGIPPGLDWRRNVGRGFHETDFRVVGSLVETVWDDVSMARDFSPSAVNTLITFRPVVGSASRNRCLPAGNVIPGNVIGALNVK